MKKQPLILFVLLCALLAGCAAPAAPTQAPTPAPTAAPTEGATEAPTQASTEAATEPEAVIRHPLTGEILEAPLENRIVAVSINNQKKALPHRGVTEADIYMEMFVNGAVIRGLALYTDVAAVESIGSVRSMRPIFTDLAEHYDLFVAHAGGSDHTMADVKKAGIDHKNIDTSNERSYSYRDFDRKENGYAWEHCLFVKGSGLMEYLLEKGIRTTQAPGKDYGLRFVEGGTPEAGDEALEVKVTFTYGKSAKSTTMVYDAAQGKYIYNQYGMEMRDADTDEPEAFKNVLILLGHDRQDSEGYHIFDFLAGGKGYFACEGKISPIRWSCAGQDQPIVFTTEYGEPLNLCVGNTYMAIAPEGSPVEY